MAGEKDVFVHISAVERVRTDSLNEDQVVEYDLVENRGKTSRKTSRFPKLDPRPVVMIAPPGHRRGFCYRPIKVTR